MNTRASLKSKMNQGDPNVPTYPQIGGWDGVDGRFVGQNNARWRSPKILNRSGVSGLMLWEIDSDIRRGDVRVVFEYSNDLIAWDVVPAATRVGAITMTSGISLPLGEGKKFLRVRVVLEE